MDDLFDIVEDETLSFDDDKIYSKEKEHFWVAYTGIWILLEALCNRDSVFYFYYLL